MRDLLIVCVLGVSGCASPNLQVLTADSNRVDGMIVLVAETDRRITPTFDAIQADAQAAKACIALGFSSAEMTPSYEHTCGLYRCEHRIRYRCVTRPELHGSPAPAGPGSERAPSIQSKRVALRRPNAVASAAPAMKGMP